LISPENLWRHEGGGARRGRSGPGYIGPLGWLDTFPIRFQKTAGGLERDKPAKCASFGGAGGPV